MCIVCFKGLVIAFAPTAVLARAAQQRACIKGMEDSARAQALPLAQYAKCSVDVVRS